MFTCPLESCCKSFKKRDRFEYHVLAHSGKRSFQCEEPGCDKAYTMPHHLKRHVEQNHRAQVGHHPCLEENCGLVFKDQRKLAHHKRSAHRADMFKCPHENCGQTFTKKSQLKTHSYWHTDVKPYCCSHPGCSRTFVTPSHLRRHLKVHEGYRCDREACQEIFYKWSQLQSHVRQNHAKTRTHVCPICNHEFDHKSNLHQHSKIHAENREVHQCPHQDCSRYYYDMKNLKAHIRSYHEGERHPCPIEGCTQTLVSKTRLNKHVQVMHSDEKEKAKKSYKAKGHRKRSVAKRLSANMAALGVEMDSDVGDEDVVKIDDMPDVVLPSPEKLQQPNISHTVNSVESLPCPTNSADSDLDHDLGTPTEHQPMSVRLSSEKNIISISSIQNLSEESSIIVAPMEKKLVVQVKYNVAETVSAAEPIPEHGGPVELVVEMDEDLDFNEDGRN